MTAAVAGGIVPEIAEGIAVGTAAAIAGIRGSGRRSTRSCAANAVAATMRAIATASNSLLSRRASIAGVAPVLLDAPALDVPPALLAPPAVAPPAVARLPAVAPAPATSLVFRGSLAARAAARSCSRSRVGLRTDGTERGGRPHRMTMPMRVP